MRSHMASILFDLEANAKVPEKVTKLWCLSYMYIDTPEDIYTITAGGIEAGEPLMYRRIRDRLKPGDTLIGHNIIKYDIPVLAKMVFNCQVKDMYKRYKIIDTLVISRALDPDRDCKRHSLEDWGRRLGGDQKVEQETWDEWDYNYITRCTGDVNLNYRTLQVELDEISKYESYST